MVTLYYMGGGLLELIGTGRFLLLYCLGGLASSAAHIYTENVLHRRDIPAHGASGSIMALTATFGLMRPSLTFRLYGIIPVPAIAIVIGYVAYDLMNAMNSMTRTGVAHAGHLGGAACGFLYFLYLRFFTRIR